MPNEENSKVVVEQKPVVDVKATEVTSTVAAPAEPSMAEYAAMRERGEKYTPKPATETPAAATDVSAAATDKPVEKPVVEEDPLTQVDEAHPAKKGIAKRMGELTAERDAANTKAAEAEAKAALEVKAAQEELAKLKQEAKDAAEKAAAAVPVVAKVEDDPLPNRDSFDDPDDYNLAVAQYAARQELRKANESAVAAQKAREEAKKVDAENVRKTDAAAQVVQLHKTFNERLDAAKPLYADFDEKVTNNEKLIVRNDIFFNIERAELGPQILYHLAENPDELKAISALSPFDAAIRLGELQADIRTKLKPKPSKAAAPVKPVASRASPDRKTPDEETMEEYAQRVEQETADKRSHKKQRAFQS